jgi:hypothetical protein
MDRLTEQELMVITRREVEKYAGKSPQAKAYAILDDERLTYAVTAIRNQPGPDYAWIIVQAHIADNLIIVDEDNVFDKKLVYALVQAGIPREQIILAYAGEQMPVPE